MTKSFGPLVSTEWLANHLYEPDIRIVDGTYFVPGTGRNAQAEFTQSHIPGAVFFDIDAIADTASPLPHMLPSPDVFAQKVGDLGLGNDCRIIVYDNATMIGAPRVWWMFRVFGHDNVAILDGGLGKWVKENHPVTNQKTIPPI
ncbi:MAG: rhodanese-like domain-containing protein [Alphaproteobacteria bacterium]